MEPLRAIQQIRRKTIGTNGQWPVRRRPKFRADIAPMNQNRGRDHLAPFDCTLSADETNCSMEERKVWLWTRVPELRATFLAEAWWCSLRA